MAQWLISYFVVQKVWIQGLFGGLCTAFLGERLDLKIPLITKKENEYQQVVKQPELQK